MRQITMIPMLYSYGRAAYHKDATTGCADAAPQVSNEVLDMLRTDPNISRDEVLQQLQQAATPVPGAESFLGAGILAHPGMLLCHQ